MLHPSCCNRFGLGKGFSIAIEHFRSRQILVKGRSFYVAIEYFCVMTEFGLDRRFEVVTKYFLVRLSLGQRPREFTSPQRI